MKTPKATFPEQPSSISIVESDYQIRATDTVCVNETRLSHPWWYNLKYLPMGVIFGIILVKGEIISWFRVQEMFRFQSFHMYGVIGTAVIVGMISILLIKKFNIKTIHGEPIHFVPKQFNKGQIFGGILFGLGWGMTGACPGPLFAQIGMGIFVTGVTIISAIAGTWVYGYVREKLPH